MTELLEILGNRVKDFDKSPRTLFISLLAGLLFLTAVPASASFDYPRVVNPYTNTSPSGKFTCEVDPTDIYGRGDAKYRVLQHGSVVWQGVKPFTFVECAVTDDGVVAGYGYTYGENGFSGRGFKAGVGDFVVAMIGPTGGLRLHETLSRRESQFLHDIPNPLARGIILDVPGNRFIVRVRDADINRSRESWRRDYNVDGNEAAEDELRDKIWAEGAILDASKSNRFTLFSVKRSEEISFLVERDTQDRKKWIVTEVERRKHMPTLDVTDKPLPSKTNALTVLGSFSLETAQTAQSELFRDVVGFGFDGAGKIGLLRSGKNEDYKLTLVETNGAPFQEVPLPNPTDRASRAR